jgi:hypothetical protein
MSVPCVISHRVKKVSTLNLWQPRFASVLATDDNDFVTKSPDTITIIVSYLITQIISHANCFNRGHSAELLND